jgi:hypothetical protein
MTKNKADRKNKKSENSDGAISDGTLVLCAMRNEEWHDAKIIGSRPARKTPKNPKSLEANFDYYVHYEGYDRRNDEWVEFKRINKDIGPRDPKKDGHHHGDETDESGEK